MEGRKVGARDMAMAGPEIEQLIREAFPDAKVIVTDLAGDGDHFGARVISEAFVGKSRIQQHQMVYAALKGKMGGELHALALETAIPK
jgi:stress-induced morphogen